MKLQTYFSKREIAAIETPIYSEKVGMFSYRKCKALCTRCRSSDAREVEVRIGNSYEKSRCMDLCADCLDLCKPESLFSEEKFMFSSIALRSSAHCKRSGRPLRV